MTSTIGIINAVCELWDQSVDGSGNDIFTCRVHGTSWQAGKDVCHGCIHVTGASYDETKDRSGPDMTETTTIWQEALRRENLDPEGWLRVVLETSGDGITWERQLIARGDEVLELADAVEAVTANTPIAAAVRDFASSVRQPGPARPF